MFSANPPQALPQPPSVDDLLRQRLLKLARPLRANTREDAAGRCFALSLEAALRARDSLAADLWLLRWQVRNDPDYVEHWAVGIGPSHALDLTHMQVNGKPDLLVPVSSYPANFLPCRSYPAAPLLALYQRLGSTRGDRLTSRFLLACAMHIFGHDMRLAWRLRSARCAVGALGQIFRFSSVFTLNCLTRSLEGRVMRLISRLHPQAEVACRAVDGNAVVAAQPGATKTTTETAERSARPPGRRARSQLT
jgi:hypothetical protein